MARGRDLTASESGCSRTERPTIFDGAVGIQRQGRALFGAMLAFCGYQDVRFVPGVPPPEYDRLSGVAPDSLFGFLTGDVIGLFPDLRNLSSADPAPPVTKPG